MGGVTKTEGSKREDVKVDCKVSGPPKVGEKSPKVGDPFKKGQCKFFIRLKKGILQSKKDHCRFRGPFEKAIL